MPIAITCLLFIFSAICFTFVLASAITELKYRNDMTLVGFWVMSIVAVSIGFIVWGIAISFYIV